MNRAFSSTVDAPFYCPPDDPVIGGLVLELPMPPSTNNLFAGNGKRRFRTTAYNNWIRDAGYWLITQRPAPIMGRVSILIELEEPKTARLQDCANREKAVVDLLVSHGVIQGDDQRYVRRNTQMWAADVKGARVTIKACA